MARFHGEVGFLRTVEEDPINHPGVWIEKLTAKNYYGEIFSDSRKWNQNGTLNDGLVINNRISIVADGFIKDLLASLHRGQLHLVIGDVRRIGIESQKVVLIEGLHLRQIKGFETDAAVIGKDPACVDGKST